MGCHRPQDTCIQGWETTHCQPQDATGGDIMLTTQRASAPNAGPRTLIKGWALAFDAGPRMPTGGDIASAMQKVTPHCQPWDDNRWRHHVCHTEGDTLLSASGQEVTTLHCTPHESVHEHFAIDWCKTCSDSVITFICGFTTQVVNHSKMPTTRSHTAAVRGLPEAPIGWFPPRMSNAQRTAAARAARNQNNDAGANKTDLVDAPDMPDVNPHDCDPPHKVWMGIQVCGVADKPVVKNLARNLFMNDFARCLKVVKQDVKDTFKSSEKRSENDIAVEPHIKDLTFAFHCWVKLASGQ